MFQVVSPNSMENSTFNDFALHGKHLGL